MTTLILTAAHFAAVTVLVVIAITAPLGLAVGAAVLGGLVACNGATLAAEWLASDE